MLTLSTAQSIRSGMLLSSRILTAYGGVTVSFPLHSLSCSSFWQVSTARTADHYYHYLGFSFACSVTALVLAVFLKQRRLDVHKSNP